MKLSEETATSTKIIEDLQNEFILPNANSTRCMDSLNAIQYNFENHNTYVSAWEHRATSRF